jgi:hypothetical protein
MKPIIKICDLRTQLENDIVAHSGAIKRDSFWD